MLARKGTFVLGAAGAFAALGLAGLACGATASTLASGSDAGGAAPAPPSGTDSDTRAPGDADAAPGDDAGDAPVDTLTSNRDRLLATYLAFLKSDPATTQSNGLRGASLTDVCSLWDALAPSPQETFLTLTARMQGSKLADRSSMLFHVTKLYRAVGGEAATPTDPGSCGGGEYNRLIMSMDATLHGALVAANQHQGAPAAGGAFDVADIASFWRDSHDLGGPHAPFDLSDETDPGAPRGQVQYFADPTSATATAPLGRMDLTGLVDPYAIEMDQDYDCPHDSNPSCSYTTYGALCGLEPSKLGTAIYTANYGTYDPLFEPKGCVKPAP